MKELSRISLVLLLVLGISLVLLLKKDQSEILEPKPEAHAKRYIIWNKKQFEKTEGVRAMAAPMMALLNATNVKELEGINGYSFEAKGEVEAKFKMFEESDWVIQPEYWHGILLGGAPVQTKCYQSAGPLVEIACPAPAPEPTPNPSPAPSPAPNPNPVEQDRSWGRARVHAKEAQALVDTSQVKVGVVDTGIDMSHPCRGSVSATQSFTGEPIEDKNSHGSHTSGTVAGKCGLGVSAANLVICKGLSNNGSGSSSSLAQCLLWVANQGAKIISNSWGSPQSDPMINQAIESVTKKGIAVVVANGNDSRGQLNWPAALSQTNPLVFGVSASDEKDRLASFSTYGPGTKFIAPGVNIVSTVPGGGTRAMSGTSMAAPHVAGLMAFCAAKAIPFPSCLKTENIGLSQNQQGAGLPRADLTVK